MISLVAQAIIHKYRFKRRVNAVKFSPDGKHFAVCKENKGKTISLAFDVTFTKNNGFSVRF